MGPFWERLLAVERRLALYREIIDDLKRQIAALQQDLLNQRST